MRTSSAFRAPPTARMRLTVLLIALILLTPLISHFALSAPAGPIITYNNTENVTPAPAASITTAGGSFTTLVLNATTQTPRWKAYVGNVTGRFTLQNAANYTLYDWGTAYVGGEVYSSRNGSVDWPTIGCVQNSSIVSEQNALNFSASAVDSINRTFNRTVHRGFWVGTTRIANSTCRAIATYLNSTNQSVSENAKFQEVLLQDGGSSLIYSALIDQDTAGFSNQPFDFQMIVPEDEYSTMPHTYYFWVELS